MATRIAILADTHLSGGRTLPAACIEALRDADIAIHAGDFSSGAALNEVEAASRRLHAVHGNVEAPEVLRRLPAELVVGVEDCRIAVVHDAGPASGRLERLRLRFPDADAAVFGHSHMPLLEEDGGFQIFNPGSPTQRRRAPRRTMGIAVADGSRLRFEHLAID
jgi:putative phosphoesterase